MQHRPSRRLKSSTSVTITRSRGYNRTKREVDDNVVGTEMLGEVTHIVRPSSSRHTLHKCRQESRYGKYCASLSKRTYPSFWFNNLMGRREFNLDRNRTITRPKKYFNFFVGALNSIPMVGVSILTAGENLIIPSALVVVEWNPKARRVGKLDAATSIFCLVCCTILTNGPTRRL